MDFLHTLEKIPFLEESFILKKKEIAINIQLHISHPISNIFLKRECIMFADGKNQFIKCVIDEVSELDAVEIANRTNI